MWWNAHQHWGNFEGNNIEIPMSIPTCPTDCNNEVPVVQFDECNPQINLSQINKLYVTTRDSPLTDWEDPAEWASRISNTSSADDAIRELTVLGDKPLPEAQELEISDQRTVAINSNHTLNVAIDETNETNHQFIRLIECGGHFKIWYSTIGGKIFGGNDGINAYLKLGMVLGGGSGDIQKYQGTAKWKAKHTEQMIDNPIA